MALLPEQLALIHKRRDCVRYAHQHPAGGLMYKMAILREMIIRKTPEAPGNTHSLQAVTQAERNPNGKPNWQTKTVREKIQVSALRQQDDILAPTKA